jgi:hypothetical protein
MAWRNSDLTLRPRIALGWIQNRHVLLPPCHPPTTHPPRPPAFPFAPLPSPTPIHTLPCPNPPSFPRV